MWGLTGMEEAGKVRRRLFNTWYKVETYFRMNSISNNRADGVMRMWVNGVLVIDKTNIIYRTNQNPTMKWRTLVIAPWIGDGSPRTQTMWIDELLVATGMPTENVLNAPMNVRIMQ